MRHVVNVAILFFFFYREKVQFIRNEGAAGLVRLSGDADLVILLRWVYASGRAGHPRSVQILISLLLSHPPACSRRKWCRMSPPMPYCTPATVSLPGVPRFHPRRTRLVSVYFVHAVINALNWKKFSSSFFFPPQPGNFIFVNNK